MVVTERVADSAVLLDPQINAEVVEQVQEGDFLALGNLGLRSLARVWPMLPAGQRRELGTWLAAWLRAIGCPEGADALETMEYR